MLSRNIVRGMLLSIALGSSLAQAQGVNPEKPAPDSSEKALPQLSVDPRVELVSIVFRLAGHPEYNRARIVSYTSDVEAAFGSFRSHPVVKLARKLRQARGVAFDACMSMAVHLTDAASLDERVPFDPIPPDLDARWQTDLAREFLGELRKFAAESHFTEFVASHQAFYRTTEERLRAVLVREARLDWFGQFFGERSKTRFKIAIGLLNGPNNYGPRCRLADGSEELYCILGVWARGQTGQPAFGADVVETVVHEFCHSYANPIIDRHETELKPAGLALYARTANAMRRQAYGAWKTVLYESLVRACTLRYIRQYQGAGVAESKAIEEQGRSFLWVPELAKLLDSYEAERAKYPTLESFAPRIITFFDDQAKRPVNKVAGSDAAPKVISITPQNGASDVDPALGEMKVVFDRPMRNNSWSLVGNPAEVPEAAGRPSYNAGRTTWTVHIRLKPSSNYRFQLNSERFRAFQSERGVPLDPVVVRFRTGAARSTPRPGT